MQYSKSMGHESCIEGSLNLSSPHKKKGFFSVCLGLFMDIDRNRLALSLRQLNS